MSETITDAILAEAAAIAGKIDRCFTVYDDSASLDYHEASKIIAQAILSAEKRGADREREAGWQPTHRHVKRGSKYRFEGYAEIQTDTPLTDYAKVAIYSGEEGGVWVRPIGEFEDGRFDSIASAIRKGAS